MSGLGAAGIAAIVSAGIGATGAGLSFAQAGKACLLYTSPSPRDRG